PLRHDVRRQHAGRADPAAPAGEVPRPVSTEPVLSASPPDPPAAPQGHRGHRERTEKPLRTLLRRGDPYIWLTGSALGACLLMILGLLGVILVNGLGFFWPAGVETVTTKDGVFLGQVMTREPIPDPGGSGRETKHRIQLK